MFFAIVGIAVLFNLVLFVALGIDAAMQGNWEPLIILGQGFGAFVALILLLSIPGLIGEAVRKIRRKRHGAVSPIIEN